MPPLMLLALYCAALFVVSLAGGILPRRIEMTHTRTQLAMSLVSGLMLGIASFHLLPHSVLTLGTASGLNSAMAWMLMGLMVMLILLRILHFHQPDYPGELHDCDHHEHHTAHSLQKGAHINPGSWKGVLVGLTFHTFIDGVALGAAFLASRHGHSEQLLGFGVFLAILLHKPLDAMSITALMKASGTTAAAQGRANLLFATVCPLGALLFFGYLSGLGGGAVDIVAPALAFSAGAFICIALSDLLPEVQFHSHDRVKLTLAFLLGIGISYLMANTGGDHSHTLEITAVLSGG